MGQLLHGSACTTAALRRAIQQRQESRATLAKRYHVTPKTVAKWKQRTSVPEAPMGPKQPRSTVLTPEEEALMAAFRRHTLLPLDACLSALQATLPHLTRAARHRCFARHGISRLPDIEGDKPAKKQFTPYPMGYCHLDLAEVRTEAGKLDLCVAIDRVCTFASAEWHADASKLVAAQFLRHLIAAVPDKIHIGRTDHGIQCTTRKRDMYASQHIFDRVC